MQTADTGFADVLKFRFDSRIDADDGEAGRLTRVFADSRERSITHLGIRVGLLFGTTYYVPIQLVSTSTADVTTISIPLDEIKSYTTKPEDAELSHATGLMAAGKRIGQLTQLTIHRRSRQLQHLVTERGTHEALVPAAMVTSLTSRQISVDLGGIPVARLSLYRPDAELHDAVYDAIYDYPRLRVELSGITIYAIDGVVWLRGYVSNDLNRRMVEDQLKNIPGLAELHNGLIADSKLAADVSMELARAPMTATSHIGVYPKFGEVHLRGRATSSEARQAAETVAAGVPGVKSVINELIVDPSAEVVPVLAGITNEEDMVPGSN
jgi:osmotically-inducible protein OsmY